MIRLLIGNSHIKLQFGAICFAIGLLCAGCASLDNPSSIQRLAKVASIGSTETVVMKRVKPSTLEQMRRMIVRPTPPEPSERNQQILRRYALLQSFTNDRIQAIDQLWKLSQLENNADLTACVSLLSLAEAEFESEYGRKKTAIDWHLMSVVSAYDYLWSTRFERTRNPYDPNFAEVTSAYNQSLQAILRHLRTQHEFNGHRPVTLDSTLIQLDLSCQILGNWQTEEFEKFEFVSDFDINGLSNHHRQYGLGVPLIAVRAKQQANPAPSEKYYPPNLTLPVTAFLRLVSDSKNSTNGKYVYTGKLEMIDPLRQSTVRVAAKETPLATDITAPLAYYLNDPLYRSNLLATASLLNADLGKEVRGLYMLEPYDPSKIPVVMVHGFWSSAITWTEMFNDLRANPTLNKRYQFWFYMYPTGQPFWASAKQMREDLDEARLRLDPDNQALALDEMMLVGHSMGGLISLLQTVESDDHFWRLVSDRSFEELKGDPVAIENLRKTLFFKPNPHVKRVITLGTPYKGSDFANPTTRWLGRKLLTLPEWLVQKNQSLINENPGIFKRKDLLTIETSIDSLAPDSPFFEALAKVRTAPWTRYHNVVGHLETMTWSESIKQKLFGEGDGVVEIADAQFAHASSVDEVDSRHTLIHQNPKAIWIVRQVLLQHLVDSAVTTPVHYGLGDGPPFDSKINAYIRDQNPSNPLARQTLHSEAGQNNVPDSKSIQRIGFLASGFAASNPDNNPINLGPVEQASIDGTIVPEASTSGRDELPFSMILRSSTRFQPLLPIQTPSQLLPLKGR